MQAVAPQASSYCHWPNCLGPKASSNCIYSQLLPEAGPDRQATPGGGEPGGLERVPRGGSRPDNKVVEQEPSRIMAKPEKANKGKTNYPNKSLRGPQGPMRGYQIQVQARMRLPRLKTTKTTLLKPETYAIHLELKVSPYRAID